MNIRKNFDTVLAVIALVSLLPPSTMLVGISSGAFYSFVSISALLVELVATAGFISITVSGIYFIYKTFSNFETFKLRILSSIFRRVFLFMFIFESVGYTLRMVGITVGS